MKLTTRLRSVPDNPAPAAPPPVDPRQELAATIERRNAIQREIDATKKALDELQFNGVARKAVDVAREAVKEAEENATAFVVAKMMGRTGGPPTSVKEARAALHEA